MGRVVSALVERPLPAVAPAAPRHTYLVGTGAAVAAGTMLVYGMLAVWFRFRDAAPLRSASDGKQIRDWLPADVAMPEVVTNTLMVTMVATVVMAQWGFYAARRGDSRHAGVALATTAFLGVAALNAQIAVWLQIDMGIRDGAYQTMFFTVTTTMFILVVTGVAYSLVAMFRALAGRVADHEVFAAHALYWYFLAASFAAVWFVVYVQK